MTDASTAAQHKSAMYKSAGYFKNIRERRCWKAWMAVLRYESHGQRGVNNNDHIQTILNSIAIKRCFVLITLPVTAN
jgi:hypothetical protein